MNCSELNVVLGFNIVLIGYIIECHYLGLLLLLKCYWFYNDGSSRIERSRGIEEVQCIYKVDFINLNVLNFVNILSQPFTIGTTMFTFLFDLNIFL